MINSELFKLACQCLILEENPDLQKTVTERFVSGEINKEHFVMLCSNHLVLPLITKQLQETGILKLFTDDFTEHLLEINELNRRRNIQILKQIDEINSALFLANIQPVYLKGTAHLLDGLYPDLSERMIGDIDFLVRDDDFLPTAEIVLKLGYKTNIEIYDEIKTLKDYPRLYRDDVPANIEIHRLPVIPEYSKWFTPELIFREKKKIQGKTNCFVPSDKHKLIQNFIHSQLSNKGHLLKLVSLRDMYDCHLLLKRVNKDDVLNEIIEREKAEIYFDFHEILTARDFNLSEFESKSKRFFAQHNWYLNHPHTHYYYIKCIKTKELIINRFLKAFIDKTVFKNLYIRITKREWWQKRLFKGLREYFS